jgi:hypothetical protein
MMQRTILPRHAVATLLAVLGIVLLVTAAASARSPRQSYDLSWWTVDGGGGTSAAVGSYTLDGTAGQPDPGPILSGADYQLEGGFWGGALSGVSMHDLYLPLVLRSW